MTPPPTILFLCTGNYYRSRFAELYFNHHAQAKGLTWRADSRGLATELTNGLPGSISVHTVAKLTELGIPLPATHRRYKPCLAEDLRNATRVIALKEAEHRPLLARRHAGWEDRVTYWHVHDLDAATPEQALAEIGQHVDRLLAELS